MCLHPRMYDQVYICTNLSKLMNNSDRIFANRIISKCNQRKYIELF